MTELLRSAYNPENFRKQAHELVDLLADHLDAAQQQQIEKVLPWKSPNQNLKDWENFDTKTENDFWGSLLADSIHLHHPKYMGHQVSAPIPMAGMGDLVNGILNNGSAIYEMGPVNTAMERVVIQWLCKSIGYEKQAEGFLTSGGSLGNLTALLAARQKQSPNNYWKEGLPANFKPALIVTGEAHYSIARSAQILGWGEQAIVKAPITPEMRMDTTALPLLKEGIESKGYTLLAVIGNACSTSTGSYDPLDEIADFCEAHKLWFHVDGAHGGAAAISKKYSHLTQGMHRADSVVIDFHKMMGISSLTTALLFKNRDPSYQSFAQDASYILDETKQYEWFNSAKRTIECTKNMMATKVYAILAHYGPQLFVDYLETCYDNGKLFSKIIRNHPNFELAVEPESNIVCFRYIKHGMPLSEINLLNERIRQLLLEDGSYYIVQTLINDKQYLRTSLMNPFTSEGELNSLLDQIMELIQH